MKIIKFLLLPIKSVQKVQKKKKNPQMQSSFNQYKTLQHFVFRLSVGLKKS